MRTTVSTFARIPELTRLRDQLRAGHLRQIVLTGMGGSYHLLHPLHMSLIQAGFASVMAETSELLYAMPCLLSKENVVIAVSQSGASAEMVHMLERAGPKVIAATNIEGSPLAQKADLTLFTRAGEESGVACKTSITALAALEWLGAHLTGGDLAAVRADLETVAPALETYLSSWEHHVQALVEWLRDVVHVFVVGRGRSLAAAGYGGMIQKEAAHIHGEGMSSAAFRHGPIEMLGPNCFALVMEGDPEVAAMNRQLLRDVLLTGARGALCGWHGTDGPFALPQAPNRVRPILELLIPQMASLALAHLQGREPGKFERITKVTTVE